MSAHSTKPEIDKTSPTWRSLHTYLEERLVGRRFNLETPGLETEDYDNIRGAIEELKMLLELAEPRPALRFVEGEDEPEGEA